MTFFDSIKTCFRKYATFEGTASRSEYWWFFLFLFLASCICGIVGGEKLQAVFNLATLLPSLAVGARRLHDTDRSGWWQLLVFVPVIGWIALIVFWVQESRPNRYAGSPDVYA